MTDVSFADLVLRMLLSLGIVLAIVLGAYAVLRRRQGFGGSGGGIKRTSLMPRGTGSRSSRSSSLFGSGRTSKMPGSRRGLRVVGRVGIGRTTQVVAVQFAEKVYLLGASEQSAPSILAELEMSEWLQATENPDDSGGNFVVSSSTQPASGAPGKSGPTSLMQALRDATARRG